MRFLFVIFIAALVEGCASSHNIKDGNNPLGGGIDTKKVLPGLYYIYARTNWAPWTNFGAARRSWKGLAEKSCGISGYKELNITEDARDTGIPRINPFLGYIVTEREGYALCVDGQTTETEAVSYIEKGNAKQVQP